MGSASGKGGNLLLPLLVNRSVDYQRYRVDDVGSNDVNGSKRLSARRALVTCSFVAVGAAIAAWMTDASVPLAASLTRVQAAAVALGQRRQPVLPAGVGVRRVSPPQEEENASASAPHLVAGFGSVVSPEASSSRVPKSISSGTLPQEKELPPALIEEGMRLEESASELSADKFLGALAEETLIRHQPDPKSRVLGHARAGTLLRRAGAPISRQGCNGGWYRVEPQGYVCAGRAATTDLEHPLLGAVSVGPDRSRPLPYVYGRSRSPTPVLYVRLPNKEEQASVEPDLRAHLARNFDRLWADQPKGPEPGYLASGRVVPQPFGSAVRSSELKKGRALPDSAFAFLEFFETGGRAFGLTTSHSILPLDRVTPITASQFAGVRVFEGFPLPVVFVRSRAEYVYESDAAGVIRPLRPAGYREAFAVEPGTVRLGGVTFLRTRQGQLLRDSTRLTRIEPRTESPKWARNGRKWLDVSILGQTLVAYEGEAPVYATLVSTGRDGLADPLTTHATVRGTYLIHTKHVTKTMSGDEADDPFDLRDIPYVQYFHEGYALHAAFWHDAFGEPRSHGCINLSPTDARHLFHLTDPPVPLAWHTALSSAGTLVHIRP